MGLRGKEIWKEDLGFNWVTSVQQTNKTKHLYMEVFYETHTYYTHTHEHKIVLSHMKYSSPQNNL